MSDYSFASSQESDAPLLQDDPHLLLSPSGTSNTSASRFPRDGAAALFSPEFSSPGSARHARSASDGSYSPFSIGSSPGATGSAFVVPVNGEPSGSQYVVNQPINGGAAGPLPSKLRLARAAEARRQQAIVQHEDVEDILDVPPVYRDRAGV